MQYLDGGLQPRQLIPSDPGRVHDWGMSQYPQTPGQWPGQQQPQWGHPATQQPAWGQPPRPSMAPPQPARPQGWQAGPGQSQWQQHQNWQQPAPQYPGGYRPPQPPPRKSNTSVIVAVGIIGLAMASTLFAWGQSRSGTSASTQTTTRVSPTVSPVITTEVSTPVTTPVTTTPTTTTPVTTTTSPPAGVGTNVLPERTWDQLPGPNSTNEFWVTLQQNPLYEQQVPTMDCPAVPSPISTGSQFENFATATLQCQHAGWKGAFAAIGEDLPMPKITFIDGEVQSACGKAGASVSFYCGTWDGSSYGIYVHSELIEGSNSWWRLRVHETLAHEFGHHVQMMAGVMWAAANVANLGGMDNLERSRRIELQTSCWAGRLLVATEATQFTAQDLETFVTWSQRDQDEYHGTKESNQYWWQRGMYSPTVGGCNTFTVGPERVT